jgi:hypothetical protein
LIVQISTTLQDDSYSGVSDVAGERHSAPPEFGGSADCATFNRKPYDAVNANRFVMTSRGPLLPLQAHKFTL